MEELSYLLGKYNRKKKFIRLKNGDFINLNKDNGLESLADLKEDLMFSDKKIKHKLSLTHLTFSVPRKLADTKDSHLFV